MRLEEGLRAQSLFAEHQSGDIVLRAEKTSPYKYDVYSVLPRGEYKTIMYATNRRELRRTIEEWLESLLE